MDSYNKNLHKNANSYLFGYAKELRQNATKAEELLWQRIRNRKIKGLKFRRQHPLHKYIADFYCHEKKLVIEIDGNAHESKEAKEKDVARTNVLNEKGIIVLRFENCEVINEMEKVIKRIVEVAESLS